MATQDYDGFDSYSTVTDLTSKTGFIQYNNVGATVSLVSPGLNGQGKCLLIEGGVAGNHFNIVWGARNTQAYFGLRFRCPTSSGMWLVLSDGVAHQDQVALWFNDANYSIQAFKGTVGGGGGSIGLSANNVWASNTAQFVEVGFDIATSGGTITVKVNNVQVLTLTGQTQQSVNAWSDLLCVYPDPYTGGGQNSFVYIDDLYYNDTTVGPGSVPADTFLGDSTTRTLFPVGNGPTNQWTPLLTSLPIGSFLENSGVASSANWLLFTSFSVDLAGQLQTSLTAYVVNSFTGHLVLGIYDSDGPDGSAGTLLVQSNPIVNPVGGPNAVTMQSAIQLDTNHTYYWCYSSDANWTAWTSGGFGTEYLSSPRAYNSVMPGSIAGVVTTAQFVGVPAITGTLTTSNYSNVSEVNMDSDASYNWTGTVNDLDLYDFAPLTGMIDFIYVVKLQGAYRKDDGGSRTIEHTLNIGGTNYSSTADALSTLYSYIQNSWVLNPATGSNWSVSDVNGMTGGPLLAS